jgi:EAL domain-containing protein (putative c-di-GMP-specific phosphodiesterase class I)
LQQVDVACFAAKRAGGDRVRVYQDNDKQISLQHDDMKWFDRINKALDKNQFCLYAQPIVPLAINENIKMKPACEILLRMKDKTGNIIIPDKFLPVAIRYNLASRVDSWVVKSAINCLSRFPEYTSQCSMVTINLTGQSIGDEEFLDNLISILKVANFETSLLCFEITETAAIDNLPVAIHFINTIKNNFSCLFALDDFGSGFASYKYIRELPVDIVKIDGEFVKNMTTDPVSEILIKSLNDIAQVCHKKTIAEWVEDKVVFDKLQAMGLDYAQGYYLGKPIPIDEYMAKPENNNIGKTSSEIINID